MIWATLAAAALPTPQECTAVSAQPEAVLAQAQGLQGFIYGYPVIDLLKQRHNETHRVSPDQPVLAPVNSIFVREKLLTPATQGQLRAPNADTLYLNAWFDLSEGPVLLDVPAMAERYYTLAFMDLYGKPHHLGTRTNGGKAARYALVGPSGGEVPQGYEALRLPTDTIWMLGRVLADGPADEAKAAALARAIKVTAKPGEPVRDAEPARPFDSLGYFDALNHAIRSLPPVAGEAALMEQFDAAGFGPNARFDEDKLSAGQKLGLGCALHLGPGVLAARGFKPDRFVNGWMSRSDVGDPGHNHLLRAELARGGYVNAPEESIYPAGVIDSKGRPLSGTWRYRVRFAAGALPPVNAFWSLTPYENQSGKLTENPIRRYQFGDRTKGAKRDRDGGLTIILSATRPPEGASNWLPTPAGSYHVVARLYMPKAEALDGRYALPPIERIEP